MSTAFEDDNLIYLQNKEKMLQSRELPVIYVTIRGCVKGTHDVTPERIYYVTYMCSYRKNSLIESGMCALYKGRHVQQNSRGFLRSKQAAEANCLLHKHPPKCPTLVRKRSFFPRLLQVACQPLFSFLYKSFCCWHIRSLADWRRNSSENTASRKAAFKIYTAQSACLTSLSLPDWTSTIS